MIVRPDRALPAALRASAFCGEKSPPEPPRLECRGCRDACGGRAGGAARGRCGWTPGRCLVDIVGARDGGFRSRERGDRQPGWRPKLSAPPALTVEHDATPWSTPMIDRPESRLNRSPGLGYDAGDGFAAARAASPRPSDPQPGRADMDVNGLNSISSPFPIHPNRPAAAPRPTSESKPVSPTDAVEISTAGRMLDNATRTSEFRAERLAQIKAAITPAPTTRRRSLMPPCRE